MKSFCRAILQLELLELFETTAEWPAYELGKFRGSMSNEQLFEINPVLQTKILGGALAKFVIFS